MPIEELIAAWSAVAYRHIPHGSPFDVLDFRFAGRAADNRWNSFGEPTLYLASDRAVAIAEFARHLGDDRGPASRRRIRPRQLYRLDVAVPLMLDLRSDRVLEALSLLGGPHRFLDKSVARATAAYVRRVTPAQAILVPSMAFLDQPDRWVAALFLDKLPTDPRSFIVSVTADSQFQLDGAADG